MIADPKLNALADNGGFSQTMALQPGSPAIKAANPAQCPSLDQRCYTRNGICDIGAFEFNGTPWSPDHFVYLPVIIQKQ